MADVASVTLTGGVEDDLLDASGYAGVQALLYGDAGNDRLIAPTAASPGLAIASVLEGGEGADTLLGGAGADVLDGGLGDDQIDAGAGDDEIRIGDDSGLDRIEGGAGYDRIVMTHGLGTAFLQIPGLVTGIEEIDGTGFDLRLVGTSGSDVLDFSQMVLTGITAINAREGDDTVIGSAGNDVIVASEGNDLLSGGAGDDTFLVNPLGNGRDLMRGGSGWDRVMAGADGSTFYLSTDTLSSVEEITSGGRLDFRISGTNAGERLDLTGLQVSGVTLIDGGAGNDTVTGSQGGDTVTGGGGKDLLRGMGGDDVFLVSVGADTIEGGLGTDTLQATAAGQKVLMALVSGVEVFDAAGFAGMVLSGGIGADVLDFSGRTTLGDVRLAGLGGADRIIGTSGADVIEGGAGADLLNGGAGADVFVFSSAADSRKTAFDTITDFAVGEDRIDLSAIDADGAGGRHSFLFLGTDAFSGQAGQLRIDRVSSPGETLVQGDVNGDRRADFVLHLTGDLALGAGDFLL